MRDFYKELESLTGFFGFDPLLVEQGSRDWFRMRSGVITASKAENLLAKKGTAKRDGYMAELVAQIATGLLPDEVSAKALQWGKDNEQDAQDAYSAATFEIVSTIPFIYKDESKRFGCSPDGMCANHGLELKSPWATRTYIEFICGDKIKPEYMKQCQYSMWVSGFERWDFANFDPRMIKNKLHYVSIERDEKMMTQFDELGAEFISDMDKMLNKLGLVYGSQFKVEGI